METEEVEEAKNAGDMPAEREDQNVAETGQLPDKPCDMDKGDGDVNSNTLKNESVECNGAASMSVMFSESITSNFKKSSNDVKKRNYRTRNSEDDKEMDVSAKEAEDSNVEEKAEEKSLLSKDEESQDHSCTDKPSSSSKLKRSKCKSQQSSAEKKKRKKVSGNKTEDEKKDTKHGEQPETSSGHVDTVNGDENENNNLDNGSESPSDTDSVTRSSSTSSSSSDNEREEARRTQEPLTDDETWLEKDTEKIGLPGWNSVEEIWKRECGCRNDWWQTKVTASRAMVKRLEQQFTLDAHEGCVNALHFNQKGTLLASGSDDLDIHIWDWISTRQPFISYNSGHRSNVFQTKFMPNSNDLTLISCARDGQVRVGYLSSTGSCRDTRKIAQHRGSAHKLALFKSSGCKSTFLSCGEDSVVMLFDLRENKPATKLVSVKSQNEKVALYSIDTSPKQPFEFAVSGRDQWARVYDRRMLTAESSDTVATYCPHHLQNASDMKANITCLVYNYDGSELLCSYNDEDIYLFNTAHSSGDDFARKFKGHRNNATVKGVNFYGPKSEFIVSGSDCGNIFLWDKKSSKVVQFMQGDDGGVVNVLEPHPNLPILATSGLDKNIKIWGPIGDGMLDEDKLKELMLSNRMERHEETNDSNVIDSHLLWILMRSLRNARNRGREREDDDNGSSDTSSSNSSLDSDEDPDVRRRMDCLTS